MILSMRGHGTPIGTSIIMAIGRGIMLKHNRTGLKEFGGLVNLNKEWAKSVLRRMGFSKRRASSKSKMLPCNFQAIKEQFLINVNSVVKMEDIPGDMIIKWDQTAMKLVPFSSWTMEKRGTKRVEISATDDKWQITAVFACSLSGNLLPIQLIYKGTTPRCLPSSVPFPSDWHITFTANHWSNTETMLEYVNCIIILYVQSKRKELKLTSDHSALVLFDVFRGQCTEDIISC